MSYISWLLWASWRLDHMSPCDEQICLKNYDIRLDKSIWPFCHFEFKVFQDKINLKVVSEILGRNINDREGRSDEWDHLCFGLESLIQPLTRLIWVFLNWGVALKHHWLWHKWPQFLANNCWPLWPAVIQPLVDLSWGCSIFISCMKTEVITSSIQIKLQNALEKGRSFLENTFPLLYR